MFIMKFHRLIGNKIFWIIFCVLICAAFIMMDVMSTNMNANAKTPARVIGTLGGTPVTYKDYALARLTSANSDENPNEPVWRQIAMVKKAEDYSISITEEELKDQIRMIPAFQDEQGNYREELFERIWKSQGVDMSRSQFLRTMNSGLRDQKLADVLSTCVWISPSQVNDQVSMITDLLSVEYAVVGTNLIEADIEATEEECRAFFDENKEYFLTEPERKVRYVSFRAEDVTDAPAPDDAQIEAYYSSNTTRFVQTDGTNISLTPIEEVRDDIIAELKQQAALLAANEKAVGLADRLLSTSDAASQFDAISKSMDLTVETSEFFNEYAGGKDLDPAFVQAAFELTPDDPDRAYSLAVEGSNAVYVMAFDEAREPYTPEYEDVKDDVKPDADYKAQMDALEAKAGELLTEMSKLIESGEAFTNAASKVGLEATIAGPVSVNMLPEDLANPLLLRDLIGRVPGEFCEPALSYQSVIIARLSDRQPDVATAATMRPRVADTLRRLATQQIFEDWQDHLIGGEQVKMKDGEETLAPFWNRASAKEQAETEGS